jgi:hypothetical protein
MPNLRRGYETPEDQAPQGTGVGRPREANSKIQFTEGDVGRISVLRGAFAIRNPTLRSSGETHIFPVDAEAGKALNIAIFRQFAA